MKVKMIAWSYPSSDNAIKFGKGKEGCWTVEVSVDDKPPVAESAFATLKEARQSADKLPMEYSRYSY